MKARTLFATAALIAGSALAAGPSQAALIAGWDFSQWVGAGLLTTNGADPANTLDANYSSQDPSFGLGPDSAPFGTLYFDGQFGSTEVPVVGDGSEPFRPVDPSLNSNLSLPTPNPFDSLVLLQGEGQPFQNLLRMGAFAPLSVVFEADLGSVLGLGSDWSLSFGGQTLSGASSVGIEFSSDGSSYAPVTSVNLSTVDSLFDVVLPAISDAQVFIRLSFSDATANSVPSIDNLGISGIVTIVPEPGTLLLLASGIAGLSFWGRRRP